MVGPFGPRVFILGVGFSLTGDDMVCCDGRMLDGSIPRA